jgi:hypothetical protein
MYSKHYKFYIKEDTKQENITKNEEINTTIWYIYVVIKMKRMFLAFRRKENCKKRT